MSAIWITPLAATAASQGEPLPVGSWWTGAGTDHRAATGTGKDQGTWTRDANYTYKFTVASRNANVLVVSYEYTETWSTTATDTWIEPNDGENQQGTTSSNVEYTIDLTTLKVTNVSNENFILSVGRWAWFLISPRGLSQGDTVTRLWEGKEVPWKVSSLQPIDIESDKVDAWALTYTGNTTGYWRVGFVYSKGPETDVYLFDRAYGIFLGRTQSGSFTFTRENGGWKETYSNKSQITGTSLSFPQPSLFSQPLVLGGIAVVIIIVIVVVILVMRRRGAAAPKPEAMPTMPPTPPPQAAVVSPGTKFCVNCGKPVPANSRFCGECGAPQP